VICRGEMFIQPIFGSNPVMLVIALLESLEKGAES